MNRYELNTCIGCKYYSEGIDWNDCSLLQLSNIHPDGCIYVDENGEVDQEKLNLDLEEYEESEE